MNLLDKKITIILADAVASHIAPGFVVGFVDASGRRRVIPYGETEYRDGIAVQEDTIYDTASITKSIPTACLGLWLIDQGKLPLEAPVSLYIPQWQAGGEHGVTVKQLLTGTIQFPFALSDHKHKSADQLLELIFTSQLASQPGVLYGYSNATSILLGLLVERVSGKTLDQLANEVFFLPLSMQDTTFHPERLAKVRIAPTEVDSVRGRVQAMVHDESAHVLRSRSVVGSAGLFSTVPDILNFLEMLLHRGLYRGKRYFSAHAVASMYMNHIYEGEQVVGLGWEVHKPYWMGNQVSDQAFGKTGFTGTMCLIDPTKNKALVLFSNRIFPHRPTDSSAIHSVRRAVADAVFGSAA